MAGICAAGLSYCHSSYHSRQPMAVMICHLAPSGIWSQSAGTPPSPSVGQSAPSSVILKGHVMPWACTRYPTNPAMATRPCLISAWRRKPIDSSLFDSQSSVCESEIGSKYPTTGFWVSASDWRSLSEKPVPLLPLGMATGGAGDAGAAGAGAASSEPSSAFIRDAATEWRLGPTKAAVGASTSARITAFMVGARAT